MKNAIELLAGTNEDGTVQIADEDTRGCPFCGAVEVHASENGRFTWWHAGSECCQERLTQQLAWRQAEINEVEAALIEARERPSQLRRDAETALSRGEAERMHKQADRAERNMEHVERAYMDKLQALLDESSELQRKRAQAPKAAA